MAETEYHIIELATMLFILNAYPTGNRRDMKMIDGLACALELTDGEKERINWTETMVGDGLQMTFTWAQGATVTRALTRQQRRRTLVYVENPPPGHEWTRAKLGLYNSIVIKLGGEPIGGDDDN